ncbi:MAG: hypothetical protein NVSMB2_11760 [Chloroflexota bacterium]
MSVAALSPTVIAQTLPIQTAPMPTTAIDPTTSQMQPTTVGQSTPVQALTLSETEGPYFKANSPETTMLAQPGMAGTQLTISGQALDQYGQPVANALVDFWQANAAGAYDNSGYTLRGHQYTDANGNYTVTTVVPGLYPGRTRHIHVKVQAPGSSVLTTQLFFPGEASNARDSIYDPSLLLSFTDNSDGSQSATFNFVVPTA